MPSRKTSMATSRPPALAGVELARMRREPTHPGEMFETEWLKPRGFGAQADAARRMGMSTNRLNEIIAKKRGVTPATAVLFGAVTKTDPALWLHLQADYDLWHALRDV